MTNLLYASNEMFSSTQLIRKSKEIFDKLSSNEIEKAVILRDGKPNFMLLEFNKYEKMMKEYETLKSNISKNKHNLIQTTDKNIKVEEEKELHLVPETKKIIQEDLIEKSPAQIKEFWN